MTDWVGGTISDYHLHLWSSLYGNFFFIFSSPSLFLSSLYLGVTSLKQTLILFHHFYSFSRFIFFLFTFSFHFSLLWYPPAKLCLLPEHPILFLFLKKDTANTDQLIALYHSHTPLRLFLSFFFLFSFSAVFVEWWRLHRTHTLSVSVFASVYVTVFSLQRSIFVFFYGLFFFFFSCLCFFFLVRLIRACLVVFVWCLVVILSRSCFVRCLFFFNFLFWIWIIANDGVSVLGWFYFSYLLFFSLLLAVLAFDLYKIFFFFLSFFLLLLMFWLSRLVSRGLTLCLLPLFGLGFLAIKNGFFFVLFCLACFVWSDLLVFFLIFLCWFAILIRCFQ